MIITLKDGSKKEYSEAKSVIDVAFDISEGLARAACAGEVDGEVVDLRTVLDKDCELNILTARDEKGLAVLRHTASHVMAEAVQTLFPEAKVAIGPSIDTGFYYDFECQSFSRDDLDAIEKEMKKIVKQSLPLEVFEVTKEKALDYMKERQEDYKVEMIEERIKARCVGAALRQNPQMKRALDNFKAVLDLRVNQSDITDAQIKKIIAVIDRAAFDITQLD